MRHLFPCNNFVKSGNWGFPITCSNSVCNHLKRVQSYLFFHLGAKFWLKSFGSMVTIKQRHSSNWNIFLHVNNHQLSCKCGLNFALFHDKMNFSILYFESYCFQSQVETKLRWNRITCLQLFTLKRFLSTSLPEIMTTW